MDRRQFLAAIGAVSLAGCSGNADEATTSTSVTSSTAPTTDATSRTHSTTRVTENSTTTASQTSTETTETDTPTETPRCPGEGAKKLPLGESTRYRNWEFAVTSVELTRTYRLDGEDQTRTLPDGEQFVVVTIDAANRGSEEKIWWFDEGFTLVGAGCTEFEWVWEVPSEKDVDPPISQLQRVEHMNQFIPEVGYPFDPGQEGRMWYTALTNTEFSRDELAVAGNFYDDPTPVKWVPATGTTDSTTTS